jgi:hypothetical protein
MEIRQETRKSTKVLKRSQFPKALKKQKGIGRFVGRNSGGGSSGESPLLVQIVSAKPDVQKKPEYFNPKRDEESGVHERYNNFLGLPVEQDTRYFFGWRDFPYASLNAYSPPKPDILSEFDRRLLDIDGNYII